MDLINYSTTIKDQDEPGEDDEAVIQKQLDSIHMLSTAIIQSFPMLLGFTHKHEHAGVPRFPQQGKMVGRLFALFSMWVVQRAKFTSTEHKQTASEVIAWINSRHGLG
jgi:hypothetical protein